MEPIIAVSFRAQRGISLGVTWKEGQSEIPRCARNDSPALVNASNRFLSIRLLTFLLAGAVTCIILFQAAAVAMPASAPLPAGFPFYLRLEANVSTTASHLHDVVKARIVREVDSDNGILIPLGAEVQGQIEKLIPSSSATDRARLLIHFDKLIIPGKPSVSFAGHIAEVENAREKVLQDGTIQGVLASDMAVGRLEDAMGKMQGQAAELSQYEQKAFGKSDTSINYGAGTGLDVHPGVVSHAIDPDLDAERAKLGADLRVTGLVTAEQLVTRPDPLSQGSTATGGTWKTDGRLLVIDLAGQ